MTCALKWLVHTNQPPSALDDDLFRDMTHAANSRVEIKRRKVGDPAVQYVQTLHWSRAEFFSSDFGEINPNLG